MIRLDNVSKNFGRQVLYEGASMSVFRGDKVGLVGPNGSGKSTIFRMIAGQDGPDHGNVTLEKGLIIGYFDQNVGEMSGRTVLEETLAGAGEVSQLRQELAELEVKMADPDAADFDKVVERYSEAQTRFMELDGYSLEARGSEILAGLGFQNERLQEDVGKLSGGWKMRVALAQILLLAPDALLLDEPTNHLDIESIVWLEGFLKAFDGGLVITSHDREFLNRLVTKIAEIDGGTLSTFTGNYDFYEEQREVNRAQQEAAYARQQASLKKEEAFIARFKARASHAAQVQSRVKMLEKTERLEAPTRRKNVKFEFRQPERSGEDVVTIEGVNKAFGEHVIYDDLSLLIRRKERWCVMGVNGAGKSTLLKMIAKVSEPDEGEVRVGASVKMGYFAQHAMELLDPEKTVFELLQRDHPMASRGSLHTLAGAFGFPGDAVEKKCKILSGGEKARLVMASMLYNPPNFLVLDEPTNHLDLDTKEMLMNALKDFEGTMLFVSHDRQFLSALSNRVFELDEGKVKTYGGGYTEYVEQVGREAPGLS